jgi:hypothetical protein
MCRADRSSPDLKGKGKTWSILCLWPDSNGLKQTLLVSGMVRADRDALKRQAV